MVQFFFPPLDVRRPLDVSYLARRDGTGGGTSSNPSWGGVSLGDPDPTREIFVLTTIQSGSVSSCTIAGISATLDPLGVISGTGSSRHRLFRAHVPTGTTGTISLSIGTNTTRNIHVYRVVNRSDRSADALSADTQVGNNTGTLTPTGYPGGFLLCSTGMYLVGGDDGEVEDRSITYSGNDIQENGESLIDLDTNAFRVSSGLVFPVDTTSPSITVTKSPSASGSQIRSYMWSFKP